ncbi:PREDICTED: anaphase-promoting complex subunit 11, partial [Myotis brandtii]|uniref:anaphase-promoting complex subunit 11 n=1 Tax=Myotis brandtii TaxID=109478 RepID=UPI000703E848
LADHRVPGSLPSRRVGGRKGGGKVPGDDCPLVWGQCSHCFHMHCILKWLNAQQVQQHCPMCRQEWKFKE